MDLHSAAATIEQVLELGQRQVSRRQATTSPLEAERLADRAALEQVDYLLMEHWDTLDDIAAGRPVDALTRADQSHIWELASGVRVAQPPSEALRRVSELARRELDESSRGRASDWQAVLWLQEYVRRHASRLDRVAER